MWIVEKHADNVGENFPSIVDGLLVDGNLCVDRHMER